MLKQLTAAVLSMYLAFLPLFADAQERSARDVRNLTDGSYGSLLKDAASLAVTQVEADAAKKLLDADLAQEKRAFEKQKEDVKREIKTLQDSLKALNRESSKDNEEQRARRQKTQCQIISLHRELGRIAIAFHMEQVKYDNSLAKLDLLVHWPGDAAEIGQIGASGAARSRKWGNVEDIGIREGFEHQEKDIAWGQEIVAEARRMGQIPPEVDVESQKEYDRASARLQKAKVAYEGRFKQGPGAPEAFGGDSAKLIIAGTVYMQAQEQFAQASRHLALANDLTDYVRGLTQKIGKSSDLKVPLHVYLVWDDDPNAFALPGGFVFINTGLLYSVDEELKKRTGAVREFATGDESEIAGVLAHEIGHVAARHAHRLQKRVNILDMLMNGGLLTMIFLLPPVGIGTYYLLQYSLTGIGLLMTLNLLGVSREYEAEADRLGVQYSWRAGYDPTGFTRMYDQMSSAFGYARKTSWWRTHPAFYSRIHDTYAELSYIPKNPNAIRDTDDFHVAISELKELRDARIQRLETEGKDAPTLKNPVPDCPPDNATFNRK